MINMFVASLGYSGSSQLNGTHPDADLFLRCFDLSEKNLSECPPIRLKDFNTKTFIDKLDEWNRRPCALRVFYYAGHGANASLIKRGMVNFTNDPKSFIEWDGKSENLVMSDGKFVPDYTLTKIFEQSRTPLLAVFDCCHSDTMIQSATLPFLGIYACQQDTCTPEYTVTNVFGERNTHGRLTSMLTQAMYDHSEYGYIDMTKIMHSGSEARVYCHCYMSKELSDNLPLIKLNPKGSAVKREPDPAPAIEDSEQDPPEPKTKVACCFIS